MFENHICYAMNTFMNNLTFYLRNNLTLLEVLTATTIMTNIHYILDIVANVLFYFVCDYQYGIKY